MGRDFDPKKSGYIEVPERIAMFRAKHPAGSLRPLDPAKPYSIETIGDKTFIVYAAAAYRTADDECPGVGLAWEPFPGTTPYTRNSELMNAETSAWGRAIVAALAADSKEGIASAEEVRNRQAERDAPSSSGGGPTVVDKTKKKPKPEAAPPARPAKAESKPAANAGIPNPKQAAYAKLQAEGAKPGDPATCVECGDDTTTLLQVYKAKADPKVGKAVCSKCEAEARKEAADGK